MRPPWFALAEYLLWLFLPESSLRVLLHPLPSRSPHSLPHAYPSFSHCICLWFAAMRKEVLKCWQGTCPGPAESSWFVMGSLVAGWVFNQSCSRKLGYLGDPIVWGSQWERCWRASEKQKLHSEQFSSYMEQIFCSAFIWHTGSHNPTLWA